jgi:large subunit ribosomal protein L6
VSRIGKNPVVIPEGVTVNVEGSVVSVKGGLGNLTYTKRDEVNVDVEGNSIVFSVDKPEFSSYWGLTRTLVANMVEGVSKGFSRTLEVIGTGYKITQKGKYLVFFLGHSHDIWYEVPEGLTAEIKDNKVTIKGYDKQQVGQAAAVIRSFRKPEPYKGKGVRYLGETIRKKAGKSGK